MNSQKSARWCIGERRNKACGSWEYHWEIGENRRKMVIMYYSSIGQWIKWSSSCCCHHGVSLWKWWKFYI